MREAYTNAGVCWNAAVKVWRMGEVPTTATAILVLCLFSAMTTVAVAVARTAANLSDRSSLDLGCDCLLSASACFPFSVAMAGETET